jgi:hypothetical protein
MFIPQMRVFPSPRRSVALFAWAEAPSAAGVLSETLFIFVPSFFHVGESSSWFNTPPQPIVEVKFPMISGVQRWQMKSLGKRELSDRLQFVQEFNDAFHGGLTESGHSQHRSSALAL